MATAATSGRPGTSTRAAGRTTRYTFNELVTLWKRAGGEPFSSGIAAGVAIAESSGDPNAVNQNTNGTVDRGLWQINSVHGAKSTFDPLANARAAVAISKNGKDWTPWAAWNQGKVKTHDLGVGASDYADTAGKAATKVAELTVPDFLKRLGVLFERDFWQRVGYVALGVVALTLGVWFIGRQFVSSTVASVAKDALRK